MEHQERGYGWNLRATGWEEKCNSVSAEHFGVIESMNPRLLLLPAQKVKPTKVLAQSGENTLGTPLIGESLAVYSFWGRVNLSF